MSPSAEVVRDAFGFAGSIAIEHPLAQVPVLFFVDVDPEEVRRRDDAGVGAITDRRTINALWELPAGIEFPPNALPDWVVDRLSVGVDGHAARTVRRDLRPPLTIHAAAATAGSLSRILGAIGQLSSVCATAAVVTGTSPAPTDPTLLNAQLFGVAVGLAEGAEIRVLNHAQPVRPDIGAYQWHLAEMLYAELVRVS
ncbi:MAG: hypothetical protein IT195_12160 [Microthrixaceae bacterium]|nr:hypothetical protein [Microthrixaceae bacterium]